MFSKYQDKKILRSLQKNPNWKLLKFSDVLRDETKNAKKIKKEEYLAQGSYPIIDQGKDYIAGFTNDREGVYDKSPLIIFGDHTRILKYIDFPIFIGADGVKLLKNVFSEEEVLTKYIYYYLRTVNIPDTGYNRHFKFLKEVVIPIPNIYLQKRIVFVLDKAQEFIDKRKAQIEALDQLTQSVFLEMFGNLKGEKVPLSELCDVNPSKKEIENIDKELPVTFLPMANVSENGELDLSETRLIKEVFDGFTYFREGDVLFAKITPCMENGKGAIARNLINNIGFGSTEFHVLRPKENVNSTWLYYLTSLQSFRKQAEANMTGSAGQKRVPKQFFSKYKVVLPPIELQNQFAEIVHKIQSQKEIMKKSLEELENNFNSLMQRTFKGELFND
ncbi:restriction endonuclease subunit S [Parageobacillus thermoglucosidasius]|uniref:restriction endonuclease subunit S n=1 Tax=Parageobacillus thermoglucosidasius TaxID=1426 RepID=UPI00025B3E49|nr:restriction endonuclease subunit S [Parageobacillus thermoglucosidasius]KYD17987.1 Type I restriction-modification system, specificity subunit S [Anoxybacillus flavithermus]REK52921.1 MAG: restriction endonuclease subunit S [Geobacillus sp.]EID42967.1 type I site-specific restriction-modification system, specificity subunit [Parageobacillus thermoglucosidasius TNO-09.020]OAO85232.1 Type I restriction-modification system specificity subunit S [Parageobacillus thermoglucosidasius]BDG33574.1 h